MTLWEVLESLPGPAAVEAQWRRFLKQGLDFLRPLLTPGQERARSYPRLDGPEWALPYRVVEHGPDEYVGVCPDSTETVPLKKRDLVVYELNKDMLCQRIAVALELDTAGQLPRWQPPTAYLGAAVARNGRRTPVYLAVPLSSDSFQAAVSRLVNEVNGPFILLAPTRRWLPRAPTTCFRDGRAFVALSEALVLISGGRFRVMGSLEDHLEGIRGGGQGGGIAEADVEENVFRKEGPIWRLRYDRKEVPVQDILGMHYLAHLIRKQGHDISAATLVSLVKGNKGGTVSRGQEVLDAPARQDLRDEYETARDELVEARAFKDLGRVAKAEEAIAHLAQRLKEASGKGRRSRRLGDQEGRHRSSVTNRITDAIRAIEQEDHPALARHLQNSVTTGTTLSYCPERYVHWLA